MPDLRLHLNWMGIISNWLLFFVCIGSTICACTPTSLIVKEAVAQVDTAVQFTTTPCRFPILDQQAVECGDLSVPEDYSTPNSRPITLHVAIIKSSSDSPAPDPLIILLGGPGAHALDRLSDTTQHFAQIITARDVILFDPRGVGYSQPSLNCPELDNFNLTVIDEQLNREQEYARRLALYRSCRDSLETDGINLRDYSADAVTADVARLRQALGYDEWNLYGVSYGARLALMIMRDYPDGLRTVILDSVYPVDVDLAAETAVMHTHALATLFTAAEAEHPQFEESFFALINQLDASPIIVPVADPRDHDWNFIQPFNGADLLRLTISLVRWPQSFPHIPGLVDDIAKGQYRDLSHFLQPAVGDQLFSEGMNLSVNCQEIDPAAQLLKKNIVDPIDPRVYDLAVEDVQQKAALCKEWLGANWPMRRQLPVVSDTPALILLGEQDTVILQQWSEQATAGLPNRSIVSFPDTGHGVMTSDACAQEIAAMFLNNPAKTPDANCQK